MKTKSINIFQQLIFLGILFFSFSGIAGGGHVVGNGGYVLECHFNDVTKWLSYDLQEGMILNQLAPKYSSAKSYQEKANNILNRIQKLNPFRSKLYKEWLLKFENESQFLELNIDLVNIPDISVGVIPKNCQLRQAVVQISSPANGENRYLINSTLWRHLDENQKAALVLHELIYREAISEENRHQNSIQVRKFNQWLHSGKLEKMTVQQYIELIQSLQFAQVDAHQIPILLYSFKAKGDERIDYPVQFWNSQSVKSAQVYLAANLKFPGIEIKYKCPANVYQMTTAEGAVEFYSSNKVKTLNIPVYYSELPFQSCYGAKVNLNDFGFNGNLKANMFEFSEQGELVRARATDGFNGIILDSIINRKAIQVKATLSSGKILEFIPFKGIFFANDFCNYFNKTLEVQIDGHLSVNNIAKIYKDELKDSVELQFCR